jgi:hypothetical protein
MPKPAARKKSAPATRPARKKSRVTAISRNCSACGVAKDPHVAGCPNAACATCGMRAGKHKADCANHPYAANVNPIFDGKTGKIIETDVDGKRAKVKVTPPDVEPEEKPKGKPDITRLAPPLVDGELYVGLQGAIDEKVIFGISQPLTTSSPCEFEWFDQPSDQSVGCSAAAAFDFEEPQTCPSCQHTKRIKKLKLCLAHMALRVADELPDRQTDLFEGAT